MEHAKKQVKKRVAVLAAIAALCALVATGSLAYFNTADTARNVITSGVINIQLIEQDAQGNPFVNPEGIMPGDVVDKVVFVKNTGENDCWVRFRVATSIKLAQGVAGEPDSSLIQMDFNTAFWTLQDGFWYYNEVLVPGETTEPLFTKVTFNTLMDNLYQKCVATIDVQAFAVQAKNNGEHALEAAGWPVSRGEE